MATAWITEYGELERGDHEVVEVAPEPALVDQTVDFTTEDTSAAFNVNTRYVRIWVDATAHIQIGSDPTATTSMQPIAALKEYWRRVDGGHKISVAPAA